MGRLWPTRLAKGHLVCPPAFFGAGGQLPTQRGLHRKHVVEACHDALKRLRVDYLDLYFCHRPDKQTPMEETVWTMHQLIQQGKVLYWGTSEWSAAEIMDAHRIAERHNLIGPVMEQPQYNMFVRRKVEVEFQDVYRTVGLGTTIWSPLASGLLTGKYNRGAGADVRLKREELSWLADIVLNEKNLAKVERLGDLARDLGTTLPKLALAWCLKNPDVSTVLSAPPSPSSRKTSGSGGRSAPDGRRHGLASRRSWTMHPPIPVLVRCASTSSPPYPTCSRAPSAKAS